MKKLLLITSFFLFGLFSSIVFAPQAEAQVYACTQAEADGNPPRIEGCAPIADCSAQRYSEYDSFDASANGGAGQYYCHWTGCTVVSCTSKPAFRIPWGTGTDFLQIEVPGSIPTGSNRLPLMISWVIGVLITLAIGLAILFLMWGGILWITAGSDKAKVEQAKKTITYAIIGLVVVLMAFVIVITLGSLLQAPFLQNPGVPTG